MEDTEQSKVQTAKDEAVAQVRSVADTAAEQTRNVVSDVTDEVTAQLGEQKSRLSSSISDIGDELDQAAQGSSGTVAGIAGQAADTTKQVARWIDTHDARDVLAEIEDFARQRPVLFVAGAAALGFLVGRVTRNAVAVARDDSRGKETIDLRAASENPAHLTGQPIDEQMLAGQTGPLHHGATGDPVEIGDVLPEGGTRIGEGRT